MLGTPVFTCLIDSYSSMINDYRRINETGKLAAASLPLGVAGSGFFMLIDDIENINMVGW